MIQQTLKTTHGRLTIKIPSLLEELTLGQLIELQEKPELNDIEAISILSGIPLDQLKLVENYNDLMVFSDTVLSLAQQIATLYNHRAIPKAITLFYKEKAVKVDVLKNLSIEPAGAFMAASEIIAEEMNQHLKDSGAKHVNAEFNPSLKACCQVLAHYFYCRATGQKYDEYKAEEFAVEIKKMKVVEALPISAHFFSCYPNLSKPRISFWRRLLPRWRRKPVFTNFKNSSISIP
ncbi:MAG: hypothetical protein ACXVAY_00880 [Mucilaginibacter sp.]